jgi:carbon-monoxide dehydrogenase large subunit
VEDRYLLTGRSSFVDDLSPYGSLHLAFVRSDVASAEIVSVDVSAALRTAGVVVVLDGRDLADLPPLRAVLDRPEFVQTDLPILARERVRHVGEPVAVVVAETLHAAEDGAEAVVVEYRHRQAVASIDAAIATGAPLVHEEATGNILLDFSSASSALIDEVFAGAAHVVEASVSTGRLTALPLEGRACLATFDERTGQVILHSSTQVPHIVRTGVALSLGLDEHRVRVISPDVGGGFGQKCVVAREEVITAALARRLRRPVKWTEDRREGMTSGYQAREQRYFLRGAFDAAGRLLGLDADILCDVGAYSCYPFSCGVEVLMAANELPGPYRLGSYRVRSRGVATNKPPIAPYRGVSRPQAVLAIERLMDVAGAATGLGPIEVRDRNLVGAGEFPYRNVMGASYDESLARCAEELSYTAFRKSKEEARASGRMIGIGFATFVEPTAYGTATFGARRMTIVPGYEQATVRMDASGSVIVLVGTHSHGQGHATTYAQIIADRLGLDIGRIQIRQGDTELVPHGWGTFASRSIVAAGGALTKACDVLAGELCRIAAHLLEAAPTDVRLSEGRAEVLGTPSAFISIDELARTAHHKSDMLPPELGRGLEATESFDPEGTYSNATHGALVELDRETGAVKLLRLVVVEDCGVMINPMIVDGQVAGGVVQGIGSALLEELVYDAEGQPLATTLADYLVPTATDVPRLEIHHLETPSSRTTTGAKGMGEGGAIGAPAAILNAVNDALSGYGEIVRTPIRPADVLAAMRGRPWASEEAS